MAVRTIPYPIVDIKETIPFTHVEAAWFWFVKALDFRHSGARFRKGFSDVERPCEPMDIMTIVNRMYRQRHLHPDHLRIMVHYGRRQSPPDPRRRKEMRASTIWAEAMDRLQPMLEAKGIVQILRNTSFPEREAYLSDKAPAAIPSIWMSSSVYTGPRGGEARC